MLASRPTCCRTPGIGHSVMLATVKLSRVLWFLPMVQMGNGSSNLRGLRPQSPDPWHDPH